MQSASVNFSNAASGAAGLWADPELRADWLRDGFLDADGTTLAIVDLCQRTFVDGLGMTDSGHTYTNVNGSASDYDADGTALVHSISTNGQARHSLITGVSMLTADQTIGVLGPVPTGDGVEAGVLFARYQNDANHYRFGIIINIDASVTALIVRALAGVETVLVSATVPGLTFMADKVLLVNGHMTPDNILQMKVWREGLAVPQVWHAQIADNAISAAGQVGFRSAVYPANTNVKPVQFRYTFYRAINGSIDDLRKQLQGWSVEHHLDDGLPDSVAFVSGVGTPTLTADLAPPPAYHTNGPVTVREYYSPYNELSPVWGLDRDIAPITLDHGVVTTAGPERVRVFTGQMADIPVKGGKATLSAMSATRLALARLVQPPAVNGAYQGANATWPISFALAACGVYPTPPPQTGCRWWAPMHGSVRSFIPARNMEITDIFITVDDLVGPNRPAMRLVDGPFGAAAVENGCNPEFVQRVRVATAATGLVLEEGPDVLSQTGAGKLEQWVRGDDVNLNFSPGGSGGITNIHRFTMVNANGVTKAECLVRSSDRKLSMTLTDGTNTASVTSTNPVPTDGAWHFVGWAWDVVNKKVWVNLDGSVQSATNGSLVVGSFPATEDWDTANDRPTPSFTLPCAEVQLTGGITPDTGQWLLDIPFTQQALIDKSDMELANIAETAPVEAWSYIAGFAQAELAAMRTDELDVFNYFTLGHWVQDAQQLVAEIYSTEFNTGTVDINIDPTKIRNEVVVSFDEMLSPDSSQTVFATSEAVQIPPGITTLVLPLSKAAFELRGFSFANVAATDTVQPVNVNSVSFNGSPDGTGTYYSTAYVTARVTVWDPGQAIVEIDNDTSITMYLANDKNWPSLTLAAKAQDSNQASVTDSDATSIATRGERSIPVTSNVLQTRVNARRLARRLLAALRKPVPQVEALELFYDARRQPGDLVQFEDPTMTRVSGLWRAQAVGHLAEVDEEEVSYTNTVIVRPTKPICVVGTGLIGDSLVGPG